MVLLIIIPIKWLFHWEYTLFSDIPRSLSQKFPTKHGFSIAMLNRGHSTKSWTGRERGGNAEEGTS
jgi:hypothetical protein